VKTLKVVSGFVTVPIVCDRRAASECDGALTLKSGRVRLGGGQFATKPGKRDPVLVALTKKARALMRSHKRLRAKLFISAKDRAGKKARVTRSVQLVRSK
jgi:hypothetical protein